MLLLKITASGQEKYEVKLLSASDRLNLYVAPDLALEIYTFCSECIYAICVDLRTAITSLYNIKCLALYSSRKVFIARYEPNLEVTLFSVFKGLKSVTWLNTLYKWATSETLGGTGRKLKFLCVLDFTVFAEEANKSCCLLCPSASTQRSMEVIFTHT
jgi:hypothetical protein